MVVVVRHGVGYPRLTSRPTRGEELGGALVLQVGLGADRAGPRVVVEEAERDLVEGRLGRPIWVRTSMQ